MKTLKVPFSLITLGRNYSRSHYDGIDELAVSIRDRGLIHPIVTEYKPASNEYELKAGFRRYMALKQLYSDSPDTEILCSLFEGEPLEAALTNIAENLETKTITPYDYGKACRALKDEFFLTTEEIAKFTNKSNSHVISCIDMVVKLSPAIKSELERGISIPVSKLFVWKRLPEAQQKEALKLWQNQDKTPSRKNPKSSATPFRRAMQMVKELQDNPNHLAWQVALFIAGKGPKPSL